MIITKKDNELSNPVILPHFTSRSVVPSTTLSGFTTLSGTPDYIRNKLRGMKNRSVVVFTFDPGTNVAELANIMDNVVVLIGNVKMEQQLRQNKALQSVIEAFTPPVAPPRHTVIEAEMIIRARTAVLESGDWFTAAEVSEMAGFSKKNPSAQPNKWKQEGTIFTVSHHGVDYYPGYALDPDTRYRPYKVLAEIIKVFGNKKDDWGLAYWFASVNSFLGGLRPQDILASEPGKLIAASKDELADLDGIAHG